MFMILSKANTEDTDDTEMSTNFNNWIDQKLWFNIDISTLVKKLKMKIGFHFRNKSCFTFYAKRKLDYVDLL